MSEPKTLSLQPVRVKRFGLFQGMTPLGSTITTLLSWLPPIFIMLFAATLRLTNLGSNPQLLFDEAWYVPDAWALGHYGYEMNWPDSLQPGTAFNPATQAALIHGAQQATHAPLGKWLIWLGMSLFNPTNPIGWRLSAAIAGTVLVALTMVVTYQLVRLRTSVTPRSARLWASVAGLLIASDSFAVVMSRVAILDIFLAVFVLAATVTLFQDRTQRIKTTAHTWFRPWLWATAVLLGAASAVKLSGLFYFAAFALYILGSHLFTARKTPGYRPVLRIISDAFCASTLMVSTYLASWTGWILSITGYNRTWAATHPAQGLAQILPDWLRSLWNYQTTKVVEVAQITQAQYVKQNGYPDTNASPAWTWLFGTHPVTMSGHITGTGSTELISTVQTIPNIMVWWAGVIALIAALILFVVRRDIRFGIPLLGVAAGWVPWLFSGDRLIYQNYAIVFLPFIVIALTLGLMELQNTLRSKGDVKWLPTTLTAIYLVAATACGIWLTTFATGTPLTPADFHAHEILSTWGFPTNAPIHG
jgi:dolichyl-phosphate-mannose--protein O-mannosyl transferase